MEPIGGNPRRRRPARAQCWSSPQVSRPPSQCACAKWVAPPYARARQCACGRFLKPSLAHGTAAEGRGLQKMLCRILMTVLLAPSKRVLWRTAVSRSLGSRARTGPCSATQSFCGVPGASRACVCFGQESGFSATKDEPSPAAKSLFEKSNSSAGAAL